MTLKYGEYTIEYTLSKNNVHIVDSYKVRRKAAMKRFLRLIREEAKKQGYTYKRFESCWYLEWQAHNYMYDKGIERARTGSVDLNEDESRLKILSYAIMAALYRP